MKISIQRIVAGKFAGKLKHGVVQRAVYYSLF
jgi:hypothetical protein